MLRYLLLLCLASVVFAHELCLDLTGAMPVANSFCAEWSGHTCCSPEVDEEIRDIVVNLFSYLPGGYESDCPDMMRRIMCARCDPWSAHLFGTEATNGQLTDEVPHLCTDWCGKLYAACNNFETRWGQANKTSIFGPDPLLKNNWPTLDGFCQNYEAPPAESCFNGLPFVPNPPNPFPPETEDICVEWVMHSTWEPILTDLRDPMDGTDRLFAAWKNGTITIHKRSTGEYLSTLIHIDKTWNNAEAGLTVLALHPKFKENGRFYVHYSCKREDCPVTCWDPIWCGTGMGCNAGVCNSHHTSMIEEYQSNPDGTLNTAYKVTFFKIPQTSPIHNAGRFWFGTDGFLYIPLGDGGAFNDPYARAQDMQTHLGKVLRIDVDDWVPDDGLPYTIPADNPFIGVPNAWAEIWALGLRNPWRCHLDSARSDVVMCGDVGQDDREEINRIVKAGNYGWRQLEGTMRNPLFLSEPIANGAIPPVIEYTHEEMGGNSATVGGVFYRGQRNDCLYGRFVVADHMSVIWVANETNWIRRRVRWNCANDASPNCENDIGNIFTLAEDANKDLYFSTSRGLYRIVENSRCGLPDDCPEPATTTSFTTHNPSQQTTSGGVSITTGAQSTSNSNDDGDEDDAAFHLLSSLTALTLLLLHLI